MSSCRFWLFSALTAALSLVSVTAASAASEQYRIERVTDIDPGPSSSGPSYLAVFNDALYSAATVGRNSDLWRYDGTSAARTADISPGLANSNPAFLAEFRNALYFQANGNDGAGFELWRLTIIPEPDALWLLAIAIGAAVSSRRSRPSTTAP